jgi:hypothetical protein
MLRVKKQTFAHNFIAPTWKCIRQIVRTQLPNIRGEHVKRFVSHVKKVMPRRAQGQRFGGSGSGSGTHAVLQTLIAPPLLAGSDELKKRPRSSKSSSSVITAADDMENVPRQPSKKRRGGGAEAAQINNSPMARDILSRLPHCREVLYEQMTTSTTTRAHVTGTSDEYIDY